MDGTEMLSSLREDVWRVGVEGSGVWCAKAANSQEGRVLTLQILGQLLITVGLNTDPMD